MALALALTGYGGIGTGGMRLPGAPFARLGAIKESPADEPLEISSPAFDDGAPIPPQYTCQGINIAPPLTWSAPLGAALVVDDLDAPREPFVHWIVVGIAPGLGSTSDGQTPDGAISLTNSAGWPDYAGPCPAAGTGTHHYRFTLYQLPDVPPLAGLAGPRAAEAIAQAATAQARVIGTVDS